MKLVVLMLVFGLINSQKYPKYIAKENARHLNSERKYLVSFAEQVENAFRTNFDSSCFGSMGQFNKHLCKTVCNMNANGIDGLANAAFSSLKNPVCGFEYRNINLGPINISLAMDNFPGVCFLQGENVNMSGRGAKFKIENDLVYASAEAQFLKMHGDFRFLWRGLTVNCKSCTQHTSSIFHKLYKFFPVKLFCKVINFLKKFPIPFLGLIKCPTVGNSSSDFTVKIAMDQKIHTNFYMRFSTADQSPQWGMSVFPGTSFSSFRFSFEDDKNKMHFGTIKNAIKYVIGSQEVARATQKALLQFFENFVTQFKSAYCDNFCQPHLYPNNVAPVNDF